MPADAPWAVAVEARVIIDNDWSGDPDGLVALAHHLLSPSNEVLAVTSSFLEPKFASPTSSSRDAAAAARELIGVIDDPALRPDVHHGSDAPFSDRVVESPAADAIVDIVSAHAWDPVVVVCGGPLTNVADALFRAPRIASRMRLVWVGGALQDGADEYNHQTDPAAAEFVLACDDLDVIQIPLETYRRCAYTVDELQHDVGGSGRVGAWLWQRYRDLPLPPALQPHAVWALGDSPPVLVTALGAGSCTILGPDPSRPGARVSTCTAVDMRVLVGDMLAKLRLHERRASARAGS